MIGQLAWGNSVHVQYTCMHGWVEGKGTALFDVRYSRNFCSVSDSGA